MQLLFGLLEAARKGVKAAKAGMKLSSLAPLSHRPATLCSLQLHLLASWVLHYQSLKAALNNTQLLSGVDTSGR